ncbi:hypothetical protein A2769_02755 [Candidatus Daviesbacteria bacterium RIFCSPHIGHO2_01_FULL_37_27]|nr:MAG: hypothetical protein A2769_02755 [Candidatus Daviesbacteria bacterium RIFCSPHIGHO2_01_FULL_37_27]
MKFKFDDSNGDLDESDKQLFQFLIQDKQFLELVIKARQEMGIDESNLPVNFATAQFYEIAKKYTEKILELYDLHHLWFHPISFFIVTGKVQSPGSGIYMSGVSGSFDSRRGEWVYSGPFEITITENIGIDKLYKFIGDHRNTIKAAIKQLPKRRISIKDLRSLKIRLEIKKLEGVSVKEISEKLIKYKDLDEQKIINYIRRNKQYIEGSKIT